MSMNLSADNIPNQASLQIPNQADSFNATSDSNLSGRSKNANSFYFDLDRTNAQGQTPIFLTVTTRSIQMLKFLMQNQCSITIKDSRGDNIRDHIYRFMAKDT